MYYFFFERSHRKTTLNGKRRQHPSGVSYPLPSPVRKVKKADSPFLFMTLIIVRLDLAYMRHSYLLIKPPSPLLSHTTSYSLSLEHYLEVTRFKFDFHWIQFTTLLRHL